MKDRIEPESLPRDQQGFGKVGLISFTGLGILILSIWGFACGSLQAPLSQFNTAAAKVLSGQAAAKRYQTKTVLNEKKGKMQVNNRFQPKGVLRLPHGSGSPLAITAIVIGIGFLSAIVLPCFVGSNQKAKSAAVKGNMRTVQVAAESYATDNKGVYPSTLKELGPYLPGGSNSIGGTPGQIPINAIDEKAPGLSQSIRLPKPIDLEKEQKPYSTGLKPGEIGYVAISQGVSYAVIGTDDKGEAVTGVARRPMILTNQEPKLTLEIAEKYGVFDPTTNTVKRGLHSIETQFESYKKTETKIKTQL